MFIAHKREDGCVQPLKAHLEGVAALAGEFAAPFGGWEHARRTGLLHDLGKYSPAGQRRMNDPEHTPKVDHSTAGAKEAMRLRDPFAAFAVAGHHAGLMNKGGAVSTKDDGSLLGRCKKELTGSLDYSTWRGEITIDPKLPFPACLDPRDSFGVQFYTRMLFSCLVDADFLDTERFMQGETARGGGEPMAALLEKLHTHVQNKFAGRDGALNRRRSEILQKCLDGAALDPGLFTLTVPTGGGKTVSSLAFALSHAARHNLKRVIYVIPYTSIIEQNAQVFRDILGEENVVEHHANVDFDGEDCDERLLRQKLATENWDAPVIVTTAVQFFESLFSAKVSRCRKLHNIAESVVIFDEAQMIPANYLRPCAAAIAELAKRYRVSAVLCTATQPALDDLLHEFAPGLPIRELCPDAGGMVEAFRRVRFEWHGELRDEALAEALTRRDQALCVVNTRARAQALWALLPQEGRFHLSTRMTAEHRSAVLAEIRRRLDNHEVCRVVSTSLIEAGVDVDFPEVWRELAGLDSILQAAGRCNREGKNAAVDSAVHVFRAEGRPPRMIQQNIGATEITLDDHPQIDAPEAIRAYFTALRSLMGKSIDYRDILPLCAAGLFRDVSENFHLIDEDTTPVYIPTGGNAALLDALRAGAMSRSLMRKLGRSAVNVYRNDLRALYESGKLERTPGDAFILADTSLYDEERGLTLKYETGDALFS